MFVKGIIYQDFVNYKKPALIIEMPRCDFKCDKECGSQVCQNSDLARQPDIKVDAIKIVKQYISNPITEAIVFQGLEPFYDEDLLLWINLIRCYTHDDIVIYTGFNKEEIESYLTVLKKYDNIIVKFGRYIPNTQSHYDPILGIKLASPNQYAERLS